MVMRPFLVLLAACGMQVDANTPEVDPCGLPTGVDLADLEMPVANLMMRRALICNDHRFGRIDDEQYRRLTAALDAELVGKPIKKRRVRKQPDPDTRLIVWAETVVDFSTQYSPDAWSANQVLGAPDVYPAYGDHNKAWASHGSDDRAEYIEVGFGHPERVSGVEIYETFNPGAIDKIELITRKGRRIEVPIGAAPAPDVSSHSVFDVRCTQDPIVSVRVSLDSQRVSGWNELDAIGVVPCTR
jgi:hypothetical protein